MDNADIGETFDVPSIIRGLSNDLTDLRAGKISANEAKVRADIAKQIFNGLRLVVTAQKFLSAKARAIPSINPTETSEGD